MFQKLSMTMALILAVACLPFVSQAQQWGNYTLYSTLNGTTTYLVDTNGNNVHTWSHTTANRTGYSTYMIPGGTLVRAVAKSGNSFSGGPICGQVQKVDYSGNIIWDFVYSTTQYCTHHDICPLPNGNVLLIAYERKTIAEVTAAGCSMAIEMWPDKIVEVEPVGLNGGNIVWEWHAWDHLVQNVDPTKANYQPTIVDHPELLNINYNTQKDWLHMNGVSFNPMLNQIAWSSHTMSEIYVIDHSTTTTEAAGHTGGNSGKGGDILYRWGHPIVYGASGSQVLNVVHDAHWNPEGVPNSGFLCGYNNQGISANASCADQVDPPYNGYTYTLTPGSAYQPPSYTIRQASGGYNSNMGNIQVLPNGNMILCVATAGIIKEFSPTGTLLWSKTATGSVPKAFRYDSCYVFSTPAAQPVISLANDTLFSTPAITYQWYLNGYQVPGANGAYYAPTQSGNYLVRITDANGCTYYYSADYAYTMPTGIATYANQESIEVYPNPTDGVLYVNGLNEREPYEISVTDAVGNVLARMQNTHIVDLTRLPKGVYFLRVTGKQLGSMTRKIVLIH